MILLFDIAPEVIGGSGIVAGAVFLLVSLAAAFVAFKLLKRSVKMALRIAVVAVILVIAVAGSVALWAIESKPSGRPIPRSQR